MDIYCHSLAWLLDLLLCFRERWVAMQKYDRLLEEQAGYHGFSQGTLNEEELRKALVDLPKSKIERIMELLNP